MLTPEQIQKLKPGDTVLVEAEVSSPLKDGAVVTHGCITHALHSSKLYPLPSEHGTSLSRRSSVGAETEVPTTKHAPTRLFKNGDVVTPRIYLGRKDKGLEMGEKYIVTADEIAGDMVAIKHHFTLRPDIVQTCFLELVTPVEDLEPYYVVEYEENIQIRRNPNGIEVARYDRERHPNAKAAAEAECARLNAEWRKEQK
jgi:hypothetical protein